MEVIERLAGCLRTNSYNRPTRWLSVVNEIVTREQFFREGQGARLVNMLPVLARRRLHSGVHDPRVVSAQTAHDEPQFNRRLALEQSRKLRTKAVTPRAHRVSEIDQAGHQRCFNGKAY